MPGTELHLPAGAVMQGGDDVVVTPELAGWERCGLRVTTLRAGESRVLATGMDELAVLPLSGGGVTVPFPFACTVAPATPVLGVEASSFAMWITRL